MTTSPVFIYALLDPRDQSVRYVGKTKNSLACRLGDHLRNCRKESNHRAHWIRLLVKNGLKPIIVALEETTEDGWALAEKRWIANFRAKGTNLTNSHSGGEGGCDPSPETRAKLSAAARGRPSARKGMKHTPESIAKMRAAALGKKHRPETIAKLQSMRDTPETRAKKSKAAKEQAASRDMVAWLSLVQSPESIAKNIEARKGYTHSPETRAKISASNKGKKRSPDAIEKTAAASRGRAPWNKGKTLSDEIRAKLSAAHMGKKPSPEAIAKTAAFNRGRPRSAETKAKISATRRARRAVDRPS